MCASPAYTHDQEETLRANPACVASHEPKAVGLKQTERTPWGIAKRSN
jgi:hypothetical protein